MHGPLWPFEIVQHCEVFSQPAEEGVLAAMLERRRLGGDHLRDVRRLRGNREIDVVEELAEGESEVLTIVDAFGDRAQAAGAVAARQALLS